MAYLLWYDDSRASAREKITEAIHAYVERFKTAPNVVIATEDERADVSGEVAGVTVRSEGYIRRFNYWVGVE